MEYLITVATESHRVGLSGLFCSLEQVKMKLPVRVAMPSDEIWAPEELSAELEVESMVFEPWYKQYHSDQQVSRDSRHLKPLLVDRFSCGDYLIFVDGGDFLFFLDPTQVIRDLKKSSTHLGLMPAQPGRSGERVPGYCLLTGIDPDRIPYYHSGFWVVEVCPETRQFFSLWKAYCGWTLQWGSREVDGREFNGGDMHAFNLAIGAISSSLEIAVLDRRWGWLPEYAPMTSMGYCRGEPIGGLHGAGTQHTDYDRAFKHFTGREPEQMKLDSNLHWR